MVMPDPARLKVPVPVWCAIALLVASLLPGWLVQLSGTAVAVRWLTSLCVGGLVAAVLLRRAMARILLAIIVAAGLVELLTGIATNRMSSPVFVAITLAQLVATGLLFRPTSTKWLRSPRNTAGK
jgi:hypothetical protein